MRLSGSKMVMPALAALDSNGRYWLLNALFHAASDAAHSATQQESMKWRKAANDKRIRTRKLRGTNQYKVWIEPVAPTEDKTVVWANGTKNQFTA